MAKWLIIRLCRNVLGSGVPPSWSACIFVSSSTEQAPGFPLFGFSSFISFFCPSSLGIGCLLLRDVSKVLVFPLHPARSTLKPSHWIQTLTSLGTFVPLLPWDKYWSKYGSRTTISVRKWEICYEIRSCCLRSCSKSWETPLTRCMGVGSFRKLAKLTWLLAWSWEGAQAGSCLSQLLLLSVNGDTCDRGGRIGAGERD